MGSGPAGGPVLDVDFTTLDNLDQFTEVYAPSPPPLSQFVLDENGLGIGAADAPFSFLMWPTPILNGVQVLEIDLVSETVGGTDTTIRSCARNQPLGGSVTNWTYLPAAVVSPATGSGSWYVYRLENNTAVDNNSSSSSASQYRNTRFWLQHTVIGNLHGMETFYGHSPVDVVASPSLGPRSISSTGPKVIPNDTYFASPGLWGIRLAGTSGTRIRRWQIWSLD